MSFRDSPLQPHVECATSHALDKGRHSFFQLRLESLRGIPEELFDGECPCQVFDPFHPLLISSAHGFEELVDLRHASDEAPPEAWAPELAPLVELLQQVSVSSASHDLGSRESSDHVSPPCP